MKRLTVRDGMATVAVMAVLIPYIAYLNRTGAPSTQDPRGIAVVGLGGLLVAVAAWGVPIRTPLAKVMAGTFFGVLGLGIASLFVGSRGSNVLLALFVAALVLLWVTETLFGRELVYEEYRAEADPLS